MPRPRHLVALALLCFVPWSAAAQSRAGTAPTLAGEWVFEMEGDPQPQRIYLKPDGDSLRGQVYGVSFVPTLSGNRVTFPVGDFRWRATLAGDSLKGWLGIGADSSRWIGKRYRRPATARSYNLTPTKYYRGLEATAAPALRLYPGDTVRTSTVDAGGWGRGAFGDRGNKLSMGGNPLTGPFYIEGAVPGDVLVVHLHQVRTNRDWAFSGTELVDNAIEPVYAANRKPSQQDNKWTLDAATGTAQLTRPPAALAGYRVPIDPFLGAVATAPGGDWTPSTRASGSYGGNLENSRFRAGSTIYLPVSTMGAQLYLGDGHAAQGDGELTGDAMETSMDVVFSVDVIRWGFASMTRAEDAEWLMSVGVGGSLDEAARRATTDMASWLQEKYKLTTTEAAIVMGFSLRYDIRDVVSPDYGVTARVAKSALTTLPPR